MYNFKGMLRKIINLEVDNVKFNYQLRISSLIWLNSFCEEILIGMISFYDIQTLKRKQKLSFIDPLSWTYVQNK